MHERFLENTGPTQDDSLTFETSQDGMTQPLTLFAEDSHATTCQTSVNAEESTGSNQGFGASSPESLAKSSPPTSSSKTSPPCSPVDSAAWPSTWPREGLILNGQFFRPQTPVVRISARGCGLLPTPTASDWKSQTKEGQRRGQLSEFIETIPAWLPCDSCENYLCTIHGKHAHECDCAEIAEWSVNPYARVRHGLLNPRFVEWLMGLPIGYTELEDLETQSFLY